MPQDHALERLQQRLGQAANGRRRSEVADSANRLAVRAWGERAPEIDDLDVKNLQVRFRTPPADGQKLRAILSALEVPLVEALELMEYWPDLDLGPGRARSPEELLAAACRMVGLRARVRQGSRNTLIVEL